MKKKNILLLLLLLLLHFDFEELKETLSSVLESFIMNGAGPSSTLLAFESFDSNRKASVLLFQFF